MSVGYNNRKIMRMKYIFIHTTASEVTTEGGIEMRLLLLLLLLPGLK